jgi:polyferredoxin
MRATHMTEIKWKNRYARLPAVRWVVQGAFAAFLVVAGIEFARFHAQAVGGGPLSATRPPAIEAFLPISALVGLRRLVATGAWDDVHPAGLTILLAAVAVSLAARKGFCSWICPVGTLSRVLEWVGKRTLWRRRGLTVPRAIDLPLLSLKYLLLGFFGFIVLVQMDGASADAFMHAPYNAVADAKMLLFFSELSATGAGILAALALLSVVVKGFWCRYLCPYGAFLGLFSLLSPARVARDPQACNDCRACTRACPAGIPVHARRTVWTAECTGCLSCVAACTAPDVLTIGRKRARRLSPWLLPALAVGVLLAAWGIARLTGHWISSVPPETFARLYRLAPLLSH